MSDGNVHIDAEELRQFVNHLKRFDTDLSNSLSQLRSHFFVLGETWRDPAFHQFVEQFGQITHFLECYLQTSQEIQPAISALANRVDRVHGSSASSSSPTSSSRSSAPDSRQSHPYYTHFLHGKTDFTYGQVSSLLRQIDSATLLDSLKQYDADLINELAVLHEEIFQLGLGSKTDAAQELTSLLNDMNLAHGVNGLSGPDTSPVDRLLTDDAISSHSSRGYRFEVRFAARHASEIAQVDCDNEIDVRMKDDSYRELKSFSTYGTAQRRNVVEQIERDINRKGVKNIKVVFDSSIAPPPPHFIQKLETELNRLQSHYGVDVGWEVE